MEGSLAINWSKTRVLVTGGTGSFGNFIVHRLLQLQCEEVRVLSRDEKKQYDMKVFFHGRPNISFFVGDIRCPRAVEEAMQGMDVVFQAAALKQVPTCEQYPLEATATNVQGVQNVIDAALANRVRCFVAISTDKAVKPVNVMGMTKAIQERLVLRANLSTRNRGTRFCCVRYGNVLRSRGSAVPFFRQRLHAGQPIPITDVRMTRFLLTLNDAIDLVLHAAHECNGGEVFVRKAPAARMLDLAKNLAKQAGKSFQFEEIGIFPGEKINEILISEEEVSRTEDEGDYFRIHPWWEKRVMTGLTEEYSSADYLMEESSLAALIARSDDEFESMELPRGEFANF